MQSQANTVEQYLNELPQDRQGAIREIRDAILANLPDGYEEVMEWGMITYQVPLTIKPDTYNKKPLMYAALASQKNHMAVYLNAVYTTTKEQAANFNEAYKATGKKLNMGKCCVRFKKLEDLPLEVIGHEIARVPMDEFIAQYEQARADYKASKK